METPQSLNEYAYCYANPIRFVDLNGMKPSNNRAKYYKDADEFIRGNIQSIASGVAGERLVKKAIEPAHNWEQMQIDKAFLDKTKYASKHVRKSKHSITKWNSFSKAAKMEHATKTAKLTSKTKVASNLGKGGPATILAAVNVAMDYQADVDAGLTTSKKFTNLGINGAFAAAGVAVMFIPGVNVVAAGVITAVLIAGEIAVKDDIKNWLNSLD